MRRSITMWSRAGRGQSVAEMALLVPLLLLLVVGAVDLGRAFHSYIVITNAAREGARYASRFPWLADEIRDAAIGEAANSGISLAAADIFITPEPPDTWPPPDPDDPLVAQPGTAIAVRVELDFGTILGSVVGLGPLTLRSETSMVVFGAD